MNAPAALGWDVRVGMAIDRALAVIAPSWAKSRMVSRVNLHMIKRAISASAPDRSSASRAPSRQGPVNKTRKELVPTRAQARELYQKNPYARGVVNSIVANLIGCGIRPQARVLKPKMGDPDEDFNDLAEEEWKFWVESSGPAGNENFYEQQRQMQRELLVAGETLLVMSVPKDKRRVPLAVEVIPSERLADNLDSEPKVGNRIVQGVELDQDGRRVAYWILRNHPGDSIRMADKPQRVTADRVLHLFEELEPGQVRGMTRLLTCAGAFEALMQLMDFQLTRARIASAFALMITDDGAGVRLVKTGEEDDKDEDENELGHIEGGIILRGKPGEGLSSAGPAIQDQQLDAFVTVIIRMIARGLDVAYELASRDYSKVTYLSARAGENQDRRHDEPQQAFMNRGINCPVWREFIRAGGLAGRFRVGEPFERFCVAQFMPQERPWIDPIKDAQADLLAVQAGLASPIEAIAKRGKDPFKVLQDIEQFKRWAEDLGLELTIFGAKAPAPATQQEPENEDEEDKDNGEKRKDKKAKAA
jgi:lambda family phage portal protein